MGRRRLDRTDRNGDPLDGVVNLFDVAIVLAVAFLLAALSGIGLSDLLAGEDMTLVKNPGQADMELIIREGDTLQRLQLQPGEQTSGVGELIGQFTGSMTAAPSTCRLGPRPGERPAANYGAVAFRPQRIPAHWRRGSGAATAPFLPGPRG